MFLYFHKLFVLYFFPSQAWDVRSHSLLNARHGSVPKKLISNPRVLLSLSFLNNCFPYFFLTNSANILYLKEITFAHIGVWVSRMTRLFQLELDGHCNYLGKEHFPESWIHLWILCRSQRSLEGGSLALIQSVFLWAHNHLLLCDKMLFLALRVNKYILIFSVIGRTHKLSFCGQTEGDYELFKCLW